MTATAFGPPIFQHASLLTQPSLVIAMAMPALEKIWTADDLQQMPDDGRRYEIIDGGLFVSPSPSWRHQKAVLRLAIRPTSYLDQHRVACVGHAPADITFSNLRLVQPDLFVVPLSNGRGPETLSDIKHLLLAAEVLSPSTARLDRVDKRRLYRDLQVNEYWIVDLDSRTFERTTPDETRPEILDEFMEWLPPGATESLNSNLREYFAEVLNH